MAWSLRSGGNQKKADKAVLSENIVEKFDAENWLKNTSRQSPCNLRLKQEHPVNGGHDDDNETRPV